MASQALPQHMSTAGSESSSKLPEPSLTQGNPVVLALSDGRPLPVKHTSTPSYQSPLRHNAPRKPQPRRHVKETLNAKSDYSTSGDDGTAEHRINQYLIKDEIGRGSFGAVHIAVDQFGQEYAVKEFSKSRLRKRAQSNLLRSTHKRAPTVSSNRGGLNSPLHRREPGKKLNSLDLIREEIAIMKKLQHPNVVSLIEVLDDPDEDSLYMVMEMCKKGVVMKVGLDQTADPYDTERSRMWFRHMILGLEYLHAQGVIHRDIKPDNCLVTSDDTLKIVDFGVSEMFEKDSDMNTAKSAGSPAFMPPELCVAKHGEVSGRACDIWSMGVTLYCLCYGRIPFEKTGVLELYESIKTDEADLGSKCTAEFKDLMDGLLKKNPQERITMDELREHPWVTKGGTDPLPSKDENIDTLLEPPTEEELNNAITGDLGRLFVVMKAAKKFKQLLVKRRPELFEGIFGTTTGIVQPPLSMHTIKRTKSSDLDNRPAIQYAMAAEGVHADPEVLDQIKQVPASTESSKDATAGTPRSGQSMAEPSAHASPQSGKGSETDTEKPSKKGQAHDPLQDTLYLGIGSGVDDLKAAEASVCESPGAVEINVYEQAYQEELERILAKNKEKKEETETKSTPPTTPVLTPTLYLTRRVEHIKRIRDNEHITDHLRDHLRAGGTGFHQLVQQARQNIGDVAASNISKLEPIARSSTRVIEKAKERTEAAKEPAKDSPKDSPLRENRTSPSSSFGSLKKLVGSAKQRLGTVTTKSTKDDAK